MTEQGTAMVDSYSLQLVFAAEQVNEQVLKHLVVELTGQGYASVTASMLGFLSALECGVNYGSDIARRIGVSRQMAGKTIKDLCAIGYLQQVDDGGKQKPVVFTKTGENLIADARKVLADIDCALQQTIPLSELQNTLSVLASVQVQLSRINES